jgi:hypothetical protein
MIWRSTWAHHAATSLAGYTLLRFFAPVSSLIVSVEMVNVAGASKKSFQAALVFIFYDVGNIIGHQLIKTPTIKSHYPELWLGIIISSCIVVALAALLYFCFYLFLMRSENMRRDKLALDEKEAEEVAFVDLTNKENLHFRYAYRRFKG